MKILPTGESPVSLMQLPLTDEDYKRAAAGFFSENPYFYKLFYPPGIY